MASPLMAGDCGEHRKIATSATSPASTMRLIEWVAAIGSSMVFAFTPWAAALAATSGAMRSALVRPGWTSVTLMLSGPNSSAMFLVSAATATLRMLPTVLPVWRADNPLMLTMRPQP